MRYLLIILLLFSACATPVPKGDSWIQEPVKISYMDEKDAYEYCHKREGCTHHMNGYYWIILNRDNPFCDTEILQREFKHIIDRDECLR